MTNDKKEYYTCQPYMELLVDELLVLNDGRIYNAYKGAPFAFKCDVISYVLDYPGMRKVFNWCIQRFCSLRD